MKKSQSKNVQRYISREEYLKFLIGLRLLGEEKRKSFLGYMATLQENPHVSEKNPLPLMQQ